MKSVLLVVFSALALAGCENSAEGDAPAPSVLYTVAQEYDLPVTATLPGRIAAISRSEVRPQVDGIILERRFDEGSDVAKGQILYQIDASMYQADYDIAKAALDEAQAKEIMMAQQEGRQRNLSKARAVSQQDLDTTISGHRQAKAQVARARAELDRARINLEHTKILAHAGGRIGISAVSPGSLVTDKQENPLAVIQQIDQVYVDMTQPSGDVIRLKEKIPPENFGKITVRLDLEKGSAYRNLKTGEPVVGRLMFADISVGQDTGSITVRSIFDNPDKLLLPGNYVTSTVDYGICESSLILPQKSVLSGIGGSHYVYILIPTKTKNIFTVEYRPVTIDRAWKNFWIIKDGVRQGDFVVTDGQQRIKTGEKVVGEETMTAQPNQE